jgi:hypothetical protein
MAWAGGGHELAAAGRTGLTLAARSCWLLKVDPQVLHRHPVIGVRAAFVTFIREGLKDRPSSPPHCKHKCLGKRPLFWSGRVIWVTGVPTVAKCGVGCPVTVYSTCTFSACKPFGPLTTSNCTAWPSERLLKPLD